MRKVKIKFKPKLAKLLAAKLRQNYQEYNETPKPFCDEEEA